MANGRETERGKPKKIREKPALLLFVCAGIFSAFGWRIPRAGSGALAASGLSGPGAGGVGAEKTQNLLTHCLPQPDGALAEASKRGPAPMSEPCYQNISSVRCRRL